MYTDASGLAQIAQAKELLRVLQTFVASKTGLPGSAGASSSQQAPITALQRAQVCGACAALPPVVEATLNQDPAAVEEGLQLLR